MELKLINNLTKTTTIYPEIMDKGKSSLFYTFDFTLNGVYEDGEYTYELYDDKGKMVSMGLMQIGDFNREKNVNTEYENNKSDIIVYNG